MNCDAVRKIKTGLASRNPCRTHQGEPHETTAPHAHYLRSSSWTPECTTEHENLVLDGHSWARIPGTARFQRARGFSIRDARETRALPGAPANGSTSDFHERPVTKIS